jgi:hypothetical protein
MSAVRQTLTRALEGELARKRSGRYPPDSVLRDGYPEIFIETHPGRDFPETRPQYG